MICEICGKKFNKPYYSGIWNNICSHECFNKMFWRKIVEDKDNYVIVGGRVYWYDKQKPISWLDASYRGYGGREFIILYNSTGEIVKTNNLFYKGDVPDWCRNELPDNAEFININ